MTDYSELVLALNRDDSGWGLKKIKYAAAEAIEALQAERDRLSDIEDRLGEAAIGLQDDRDHWKARAERAEAVVAQVKVRAQTMRKAAKLQGPREYQDDRSKMKVWEKALYREGKDLCEIIREAALDHQEGEQ